MHTRTYPGDYVRRIFIDIHETTRICYHCGGYMFPSVLIHELMCVDCGSIQYITVLTHEIWEWRAQFQLARKLADEFFAVPSLALEMYQKELDSDDLGTHAIVSGGEVLEI